MSKIYMKNASKNKSLRNFVFIIFLKKYKKQKRNTDIYQII